MAVQLIIRVGAITERPKAARVSFIRTGACTCRAERHKVGPPVKSLRGLASVPVRSNTYHRGPWPTAAPQGASVLLGPDVRSRSARVPFCTLAEPTVGAKAKRPARSMPATLAEGGHTRGWDLRCAGVCEGWSHQGCVPRFMPRRIQCEVKLLCTARFVPCHWIRAGALGHVTPKKF